MTTWSGPELSAGSSVATEPSGSGTKAANCVGRAGSPVENSWSPALCQVTRAKCLVTVGLCEEKLEPMFRSPLTSSQYASSLYGATRYSETTWGPRSSVTSIRWTQSQGHPSSRPGTFTALCGPGPGHRTRLVNGVTKRMSGAGSPFATSDVSSTKNPPVRKARYARDPSGDTEREWRSSLNPGSGNAVDHEAISRNTRSRAVEMSVTRRSTPK